MPFQLVYGESAVELRESISLRVQEVGQEHEVLLQNRQSGNMQTPVFWIQNQPDWQPPRPVRWDDIPEADGFWTRIPVPAHDRIGCSFGSTLKPQPLPSTVIIVLPLHPGGTCYGCAISSEDGRLYYGHRGGLYGGGAGNISRHVFQQKIQLLGLTTVSAHKAEGQEEDVFVIGTPSDDDFIGKLARYVNSCYLLKKLAQTNRLNELQG